MLKNRTSAFKHRTFWTAACWAETRAIHGLPSDSVTAHPQRQRHTALRAVNVTPATTPTRAPRTVHLLHQEPPLLILSQTRTISCSKSPAINSAVQMTGRRGRDRNEREFASGRQRTRSAPPLCTTQRNATKSNLQLADRAVDSG